MEMLLLMMALMGGRSNNMMSTLLLLMLLGGQSGGMSLSTTGGSMPINLGNSLVWSLMPRMPTTAALLSGGIDAVIGQSLFKPKRRTRVRRYRVPRRRRWY